MTIADASDGKDEDSVEDAADGHPAKDIKLKDASPELENKG